VTDLEKLQAFVEKHPEAEMHAFYCCGPLGDYRATVVARVPEGFGYEAEGAEFVGATAEALVEAMSAGGFEPVEGSDVRALCESAPRSPVSKRRWKS
jgi:hypothetical protein